MWVDLQKEPRMEPRTKQRTKKNFGQGEFEEGHYMPSFAVYNQSVRENNIRIHQSAR
jgi:hypothetical protein